MTDRPGEGSEKDREISRLLVKNTTLLLGAQILSIPLSIAVTALLGRALGPSDFGALHLAMTYCSFAFLLSEWGQGGALTALIAQGKEHAGSFLGSALAYRLPTLPLVMGGLLALSSVLAGPPGFASVLILVVLLQWLGTVSGTGLSAIRGFERTDIAALVQVAQQALVAGLLFLTLAYGGGLKAALLVQILVAGLLLVFVVSNFGRVGIGKLEVRREVIGRLLRDGTPFFILSLVMALQPTIDTYFLAKFAPKSLGYHAAAYKLVGTLLVPVTTLVSALYPTLCRLYAEDRDAFHRTAQGALGTTSLLVVPMALGCGLFPDLGILLFSRESFAPAEQNLRVFSVFLFFVYFTMALGIVLVAAGQQKKWSLTQLVCVLVSLVFDPILVPYFEAHYQNGGLGIGVAVVLSELIMLTVGLIIVPREVLSAKLFVSLGKALAAGLLMALSATPLRILGVWVAAPLSVLIYFGALYLMGGLRGDSWDILRDALRRKRKA